MDFAPFKKPGLWPGFSHTAPSFLLLPTKFCFANFRGDPGRPKGGHKRHIACGDFFCKKPPARSLRCGSFSPRNFASQTSAGAPAAPRAAISGISLAATFFAKKRHPPAPLLLLLPTKFCFANFRGGPAAGGGGHLQSSLCSDAFLQKVAGRPLKSAQRAQGVVPFWRCILYDNLSSCGISNL